MKIIKTQISDARLIADTTVNLNSSMTATQIQALIDAQPKNMNGFDLIFQFADGTYTLDATLLFQHFYGGQTLRVRGNIGESGLHTNQAVILNTTGTNVITIKRCIGYVEIKNLKLTSTSNDAVWANGGTIVETKG